MELVAPSCRFDCWIVAGGSGGSGWGKRNYDSFPAGWPPDFGAAVVGGVMTAETFQRKLRRFPVADNKRRMTRGSKPAVNKASVYLMRRLAVASWAAAGARCL